MYRKDNIVDDFMGQVETLYLYRYLMNRYLPGDGLLKPFYSKTDFDGLFESLFKKSHITINVIIVC